MVVFEPASPGGTSIPCARQKATARIDRDRRALKIANNGSQQANFICKRFSHEPILSPAFNIASLLSGTKL